MGGDGYVLGVQVVVGLFQGLVQGDQLGGLGGRQVGRDGLRHRDDALVDQFLLDVGLLPLA